MGITRLAFERAARKILPDVFDVPSALSRHALQQFLRPLVNLIVAFGTAITWAEQHLFDRRSVVNEFELWRHALEHGRGQNFSLKHVQALTKNRPYIRNETQPGKLTTRRTLEREQEIIARAKEGAGRYIPFNPKPSIQNDALDPEQRQAVFHILASQNFVTLFRGAAGTGKSFTLKTNTSFAKT